MGARLSTDSVKPALEVLNLKYNPIGDGGGETMAAMLQVNKCLKVLDLGNTDLGMRSLVALATALNQHNRTIRYISVENPTVSALLGPPRPWTMLSQILANPRARARLESLQNLLRMKERSPGPPGGSLCGTVRWASLISGGFSR